MNLRWENEGWTGEVQLVADHAVVVVRMSAQWMVQQFLLFRDMDEPDLWLATDGHGRWGEMNGAHRTELDGCVDIEVAGSPFFNSIITHRTPLHVGHSADLHVISVDVETLGIVKRAVRYTREADHLWSYYSLGAGTTVSASVDEFGLVIDEAQFMRRAPQSI